MITDTYKTIKEASAGMYREKASKFLAFAFPVASEEETKDRLKMLKKEYFDANHHCYAYQLGADKSCFRSNDDGEPSGTAGKPIFGQIQSFGLTNVLVVVIRYFGGTKLGVSGLINAYRTAAREVLLKAMVEEKTVNDYYRLNFPYESINEIMKTIKENNLALVSSRFELQCELVFHVRQRESHIIYGVFKKMPGLEIVFLNSH